MGSENPTKFINFIVMLSQQEVQQVLNLFAVISIKIMSQKQDTQSNKNHLFTTLNEAELKSQTIRDHSIVFMGLSRAGKSALLNWLFHRQSMIGKRIGTNIFYVPVDASIPKNPEEALKIAKIGHGFASVTVLANMRNIRINNQQTSFLDFGGFGQRRNPQEIIKVNYVLATFLLKMKKVKFVLVVTEHAFNDISSNGLRDTLGQFVRLFDFQLMTGVQQQNFLKSISLCITSTTRNYEQSEIQEQLKIIIQNFQDESLYNKDSMQNTYIQKYPVCKQILTTLIRTKRFQFFPIAQVGKPPAECRIINTFNARQWQFFDLQSSRESICYPYVQQYYKLKEKQKDHLKEIIQTRFKLIQSISLTIKSNIQEVYSNICSNNLNFQDTFKQLKKFLNQNNFYKDIKNTLFVYNHNKITFFQRFQKLQELFKINAQILSYSNWLAEKNQNQDKLLNYNQYLNEKLNKQMDIVSSLIASSPQEVEVLTQIKFIIKKSLYESLVLQNLNKYLQNNNIAHTCRMASFENIQFGNLFTQSVAALKINFINQLYFSKVAIRNINLNQVGKIIEQLCLYQRELSEMDSAKVYSICSRIKLVAGIEQYKSRFGNFVHNAMKSLLEGLDFCIKQQICLEILQNQEATEKLIERQKLYINCIIQILLDTQHPANINLAIQICKSLKQYSIVSSIYNKKVSNNVDLLHVSAQYQRSIGNGEASVRIYKKLQVLTKKSYKIMIDQIGTQTSLNQSKSEVCIAEQSQVISKDKLVRLINQLRKKILSSKQTYYINFQQQSKKYRQKMKIFIFNKIYQMQLPKNPNHYEYLYYTHRIVELVAGKKINILLRSGPLRGQTTLTYALTNAKLIVKEKEKEKISKYELVDSQGQNKINQDGYNRNEYPFIRPISEDELIVDFNNIFQNQVQKKLLGIMMLQTMIQNAKAYRFIFVQNEEDILEKNGVDMIKFLKLLLQCLKWDFSNVQNCKKLSSLIYLFFTFAKDKPKVLKRMKQLNLKMKDKQKTIENQRIYGLSSTEQLYIYNIISRLVKYNNEFFDYPTKEVTSFQKKDWIKQLQKCRTCNQQNDKCQHLIWKFMQSKQFKLPLCQQTINTLLEQEKNAFFLRIVNIIRDARDIVNEISRIISEKYYASLQNRVQSEEIANYSEKLLIFLHYFLKKKKFVFQEYYLPQDYDKLFKILKNFSLFLFECVKNCVDDCDDIMSRQNQLTRILYQLQCYSKKLIVSHQFRERLIYLREFESDIQIICHEIQKEQLFKVFLQKIKLFEIQKTGNKKQRLLNFYHQIVQEINTTLDIKQIKQYITIHQWKGIMLDTTDAKIKLFLQTGRKNQAIQLQLNTVRGFLEKNSYFHNNYSIQQADEQILQQASNILVQIASQLVVTHPQISKAICIHLNKKQSLDNILQKIQEIKTDRNQKINIFIQRIVLNNEMGRGQKCKILLRNLQKLTNGQPIGENFRVMQRTLEYARNNNMILQFPRYHGLNKITIKNVVWMIQKEKM